MDNFLAQELVVASLAFCGLEYKDDADYRWGTFVVVTVLIFRKNSLLNLKALNSTNELTKVKFGAFCVLLARIGIVKTSSATNRNGFHILLIPIIGFQ